MIRVRGLLAVVAALLLAALVTASAQTSEAPIDYVQWERVAERAERALQAGGASSDTLEALRNEIAGWRAEFLGAETANQTRIDTLQSQLSALGAAPAEGESEPEDIASRRTQLNDQLARLLAPQVAATEAYNRADGVIGELDQVIRERQTEQLLEVELSPLSPTTLEHGVRLARDRLLSIWREITRSWSSDAQMAEARDALPLTIGLTAIGLLLFARGRRWMQAVTRAVQARKGRAGRLALGFVVSLGQVLLPVLGLTFVAAAATSTGLLGLRGTAIIESLPVAGIFVFGSLWLGARVFPAGSHMTGPLDLDEAENARGRRYSAGLGLLLGASIIVGTLFDFDSKADAAAVIWSFPLLVLVGLSLFRMGRFLTQSARNSTEAAPESGFRAQMMRLLGRGAMLVGVIGPIAAALGYQNLSASMVFPTAMSLALIGALVILHGPIRDVYAAIKGHKAAEVGDALVPVLISFCFVLASLPLFALIWGVRPAELSELWSRFLAGITLGETRISPADFLVVAIIFGLGYGVTRFVQSTLRTSVLPRTRLDVGGRNAIVSGVGYVGIFLAGLIAITAAGINLASLAIFASALAVGVGFGLQNIVSNFVSGIILLIERPISEGDWVEVGGQMGYVRDISVRSTRIETFDRTDVIVPNADFVSGTVINYTRGNSIGRAIVPVGVAYGTDTRLVEKILREIAEAHPMVLLNPPPAVLFRGFGADSLDFEIRAILRDVNWVLGVKSDMNHEIARRFAEEGIEIPFAQRDVWLRNPEALGSGAASSDCGGQG